MTLFPIDSISISETKTRRRKRIPSPVPRVGVVIPTRGAVLTKKIATKMDRPLLKRTSSKGLAVSPTTVLTAGKTEKVDGVAAPVETDTVAPEKIAITTNETKISTEIVIDTEPQIIEGTTRMFFSRNLF